LTTKRFFAVFNDQFIAGLTTMVAIQLKIDEIFGGDRHIIVSNWRQSSINHVLSNMTGIMFWCCIAFLKGKDGAAAGSSTPQPRDV